MTHTNHYTECPRCGHEAARETYIVLESASHFAELVCDYCDAIETISSPAEDAELILAAWSI